MEKVAQKIVIEYSHTISDNGIFPNSHLPVLIYKNILDFPLFFDAVYIANLFEKNEWTNHWKGGIYTYHHYHSNAHEAIGIYKGQTELLLGGEDGIKITLEKGDVLIIPAGVAHKNLGNEHVVACVGAYAGGASYDLCLGKPGERPLADATLLTLSLPDRDPVLGLKGGTEKYWK